MPRKWTAFFVLIWFVVFSEGCMTWGTRRIGRTAPPPRQGARIVSLVKASGATVLFSDRAPGRIVGNAIVGTAVRGAWEQVEVRKPLSLVRKRSDGSVYEVVAGDGRTYPVGSVVSEDADKMAFFIVASRPAPVSVPLSEIASVKMRKLSLAKTVLALAGLFAAGYTAAAVIMLSDETP